MQNTLQIHYTLCTFTAHIYSAHIHILYAYTFKYTMQIHHANTLYSVCIYSTHIRTLYTYTMQIHYTLCTYTAYICMHTYCT